MTETEIEMCLCGTEVRMKNNVCPVCGREYDENDNLIGGGGSGKGGMMNMVTEHQKLEKRLKELDDENEDFIKAMPEWSREMRFGN